MSIIDALKDEEAEIQALEKDAGQVPPNEAAQPPAQASEQPEPQDQPEPEAEPEFTPENRGQFIRRREYEAANEARKQAESRRAEVEAKYAQDMAKLNERFAHIAQNLSQPQREQPKAPELPDINTDPIGHFQAKTALLEQRLEEANKRFGAIDQTTQQQEQVSRLSQAVIDAEEQFTRTVTDYPKAQQHLMKQWVAEAEAAETNVRDYCRIRALEIAAHAAKTGKNPAEVAYKLATARGYTKTGAAPVTQQPQGNRTGPSIETLQRGLDASRSPSNAPGRAAPGEMSAEAILNMDDAEFSKNFGGRDNAKWEKLFLRGGRA